MKKLIRLTEGDLHRIVENSVRKTLNELDWKTYRNAAIKSRENGDDWSVKHSGRPEDFLQASDRAFENQYFDDPRLDSYNHYYDKDAFDHIYLRKLSKLNHDRSGYGTDIDDYLEAIANPKWSCDKDNDMPYYKDTFKNGENRIGDWGKETNRMLDNANNAIKRFRNGNSKYIKGKGWSD